MDGFPRSEPPLIIACCGDPDLYRQIGNSGQLAGFTVERLTCPKAGHGPPRSTDVIWQWAPPLPPAADHPSQEQTASAESARTGLPHTGWLKSPALSPLSYMGGNIWMYRHILYVTSQCWQKIYIIWLPWNRPYHVNLLGMLHVVAMLAVVTWWYAAQLWHALCLSL